MRNIWITSDTHWNHTNILNFVCSKTGNRVRPEFDSVGQMNECMMDNWNETVKEGDIVYHLGDVFFGDKDYFKKMWPKLKGRKRLIVGNHDDIKFLSSGGFFQKVQMWRKWPEFGIIMSHVPLHKESMFHIDKKTGNQYYLLNVHGHIHQNPSPEGGYKNVCVEQTNYKPVNIEEL